MFDADTAIHLTAFIWMHCDMLYLHHLGGQMSLVRDIADIKRGE